MPPGESDVVYIHFDDDGSGATQWDAQLVVDSDARNLPGGRL